MYNDNDIQKMFAEQFGERAVAGEDPEVSAMRAFNNIDLTAVASAMMKNRGEKASDGEFIDRREKKEFEKFMSTVMDVLDE